MDNVVVMTPSNCLHQLVHVVLHLQSLMSRCQLQCGDPSTKKQCQSRDETDCMCTCVGVRQLCESSSTSSRFFSINSKTRYCSSTHLLPLALMQLQLQLVLHLCSETHQFLLSPEGLQKGDYIIVPQTAQHLDLTQGCLAYHFIVCNTFCLNMC